METQICPKCGPQPLEAFAPSKRSKSGEMCESCMRAYCRAYYQANKDRLKERARQYHADHREQCNRRNNQYYHSHVDLAVQRGRRWREANPEKHAERLAERREYHRAYASEWAKKNPLRARINGHSYRARRRKATGHYTEAEWIALCGWFGNVCLKCGSCDRISIDHVVPLSQGGSNDITNLQPLCFACNSGKRNRTIDYRDPDRLAAFLVSLIPTS